MRIKGLLTLMCLLSINPSVLATSDGELDLSFGLAGKVSTSFTPGGRDFASALAIQPDGKIVVVGRAGAASFSLTSNASFAVSRYNNDGSLDRTFGSEGRITTSFQGYLSAVANAVAIQFDGKILAAGYVLLDGVRTNFVIVRYNRDGSLDSSFGTSGAVITIFPNSSAANAVAIQRDGKIIAAGATSISGSKFALVRYNTDGSLDLAFGDAGIVTTGFPTNPSVYATAVAIQPDGKIIAAGSESYGTGGLFRAVRYNSDGSLDSGFGIGGMTATDFSDTGNFRGNMAVLTALVLQPDGKIVLGGNAGFLEHSNWFALVRYTSDGWLDTSFGTGAKAVTLSSPTYDDWLHGLTLQADGKILAAGYSRQLCNAQTCDFDFAIVRYRTDGSLDPVFGMGGKVITDFSGSADIAYGVAVQPDGRIVAAGATGPTPASTAIALVRYENVSPLRLIFDPAILAIEGSFTATFEGTDLPAETYFDVRFRIPGDDTDHIATNWQRGASAAHKVPLGTATGVWTITGVRPHADVNDHSRDIVPVLASINVVP